MVITIPVKLKLTNLTRETNYLLIVRDLLLSCKTWREINSQEAYALTGLTSVPEILYCSGWKNLPLTSSKDSFILKIASYPYDPLTQLHTIDGKLTKDSIRRGQCEAVKLYSAEGYSGSYAFSIPKS